MQLDHSKPYGVVQGRAAHRFEQDGKLFDQLGNEVNEKGEPVDAAEAAPQVQAAHKAKGGKGAAHSQVDEQLKG